MKTKKVRHISIREKKRRAWSVFSKWVRIRANGYCYTCGKLVGYKNLDAGHFHGRKSSVLFMDERNVKAQCHTCNRFRNGNLGEYATLLSKEYGGSILEELYPLAHRTKKWTHEELDEIMSKYKLEE